MHEREQLEQAIAALEVQRPMLGDAIVNASIAALNEQLKALQPSPPAQPQRKLATILFADISGFTAFSEHLDAEEITEIMNDLWQRLDLVIIRFGGMVDKHIGDAVMAVWGTQESHENDPEQAIRAALAMRDELEKFSASRSLPLTMRIGINTGPVLLGLIGTTAEFTAMGDTVNVASRLEQAAQPGDVLISQDTYRHVRGLFDVVVLAPLALKGKTDRIQTYAIIQVKPRSFFLGSRGVEGVETRMIGREEELLRLQKAWQAVMEQQELQWLSVVGDAGVGKSRLLYELRSWIELQPEFMILFSGRGFQETMQQPYALLRDIFSFRFDIQDSDSAAVACEKFEQGIMEFLGKHDPEALMKAHFIGYLIGLDFSTSPYLENLLGDTRQIWNRALHYLMQFFSAVTTNTAFLLALEDVHWADDESLDALITVLEKLAKHPILVVGLKRLTFFDRRPHWGKGQAYHTVIQLQPLSKRESRQLVTEILQKLPDPPEVLREMIVGGAEGNPFYMEELIKMLIEEGVIVTSLDPWVIAPDRLATVHVPSTLTGVLQARLDSLPIEERTVLQQAAVIGRVFWDRAILALFATDAPQRVQDGLTMLLRRELIYRGDVSSFEGVNEYLFKHALLREVTYEGILKRQRRLYHARAATWLIQQSGERADEYASVIARHYEYAHDLEQAATWYLRAGNEARMTYANAVALEYYQRALPLLDATQQSDVRINIGNVLEVIGRWDEAEQSYREALALADKVQNQALRAHAQLALGVLCRQRGDYAYALEWLEQAYHGYVQLEESQQKWAVIAEMAHARLHQREYNEANRLYEEYRKHAQATNNQRAMASVLKGFGKMAYRSGDIATAERSWRDSLALFRLLNDKQEIAKAINDIGIIMYMQGTYDQAKSFYDEFLAIQQEVGNQSGIAIAFSNLGLISLVQKNYSAALQYYEEGLNLNQALGDKEGIAYALLGFSALALAVPEKTMVADSISLAATIQAVLDSIGAELEPAERNLYEQILATGKNLLDTAMFRAAWDKGYTLPLDQVLEGMLANLQSYRPLLTAAGGDSA